jgi:hypothetical protein
VEFKIVINFSDVSVQKPFNRVKKKLVYCTALCELGSSVSIVSGYGLGNQGLIPNRGRGFFLPSALCTQPAKKPTKPLVPWVLGVLSHPVQCSQGMMLTIHPLLVPKKEMGYTCSPLKRLSWCVASQLYFYCTVYQSFA